MEKEKLENVKKRNAEQSNKELLIFVVKTLGISFLTGMASAAGGHLYSSLNKSSRRTKLDVIDSKNTLVAV